MDPLEVQKNTNREQPWKSWLREEIEARKQAESSPGKRSEQEDLRKSHEMKDKAVFHGLDNAAG